MKFEARSCLGLVLLVCVSGFKIFSQGWGWYKFVRFLRGMGMGLIFFSFLLELFRIRKMKISQGISELMHKKLLLPFVCPVKTMLLVLLALL